MVVLRQLAGGVAGPETAARRFPFRVGRGPEDHLRLESPGLWDGHFAIERSRGGPLMLRAHPEACTLVNGVRVEAVALRNGDVIEAGALRLQFWLGPVRQPGLGLREALTWVGWLAVLGFQLVVAASLTR